MKRMISIVTLAFAIVLGATTAQANDIKPYAGFSVGSFDFNVNAYGLSDSGSGVGYFGMLGADFNKYLGAELRIGTATLAPVFGLNYSLPAFFSLLGKVQVPVADGFRLYALAGFTSADLWTSGGFSNTETGLSFGAGASYSLDDQYSVRAEWVRYWNDVSPAPSVNVTVDGLAVSVVYHFEPY